MKRHKTLINLVLFILVLVMLYFLMGTWEDEDEVVEEKVTTVVSMSEVESVIYTNNEETMVFEWKDEKWILTSDEELILDQDIVQDMINNLTYITAVRELEEPDDLSDYGLDSPTYSLVLKDADGVEKNVYFGNLLDGNYYVTVDDEGVVYTVESSVINSLEWDASELELVEEEETEETEETE